MGRGSESFAAGGEGGRREIGLDEPYVGLSRLQIQKSNM